MATAMTTTTMLDPDDGDQERNVPTCSVSPTLESARSALLDRVMREAERDAGTSERDDSH